MSKSSGVAVIVHSGGPTAVINASLLGAVEEARETGAFAQLLGARFGIDGVLKEDFVDLLPLSGSTLAAVGDAPSSALGSSRREVGAEESERLLRVFRARDVRYLLYTGGNGSMGTALQISRLARGAGHELHVVGIPKTIDNDLAETDHTPGYASAARFFACAVRDIGADNRGLPGQVEFVEVLGRNAGWIVAATALARRDPDDPPHLIYLPERRLPLAQLLGDVERVFRRLGRCLVAVCEGQLDENGEPFGADVRSGSRASLAMNLAHRLAVLTMRDLKIRARSEKPGLLGRTQTLARSPVDWDEARLCGRAAVRAVLGDAEDAMVTLVRNPGAAYAASTGLAPIERVAGIERLFPAEWQNPEGNGVEPAFLEYVTPLAGPIHGYGRL